MAQVIPARVIYDSEELVDILTMAVEGGIGYWSVVHDSERAEDLGWLAVQLGPTDELEDDFKLTWIRLDNLQAAIDLIVSKRETVNVKKQIVDEVCSGDIDRFDSDTADVIVQTAMFGELMYG
jgi:hypothetical protein